MLGRRLLVLAAVLTGLAALAATLQPRDPAATRTLPAATPSPVSPQAGPRADPAAPDPATGEPAERRLDALGSRQVVDARVGERVRLVVSSTELATVQVGENGPLEAVDPDAPARFDLRYDAAVSEPIRIVGPDPGAPRVIGTLRVR